MYRLNKKIQYYQADLFEDLKSYFEKSHEMKYISYIVNVKDTN